MKFLLDMMRSSTTGGVSSKRGFMVWCLMLFTYSYLVNLHTGKQPSELFQQELFQLTFASIVAVFGEPFLNAWIEFKGRKTSKVDPPAEK